MHRTLLDDNLSLDELEQADKNESNDLWRGLVVTGSICGGVMIASLLLFYYFVQIHLVPPSM